MFKSKRFSLIALAMSFTLILSACASGPPKDVKIEGEIVTAQGLNPDRDGRPSPVVVVVYQLRGSDKFETGDFFGLFNAESDLLGDDLIERSQVQLQPGETRPYTAEFDPETRFIGVVAAFRDIQSAQFKALTEIPEEGLKDKLNIFKDNKLKIEVQPLAVSVAIEKS